MLAFETINLIVVVIVSIIVICCSIGIIVASRFQNKQKEKYNNCINIIKEKENSTFEIKNGMSIDEINKISPNIDVNNLMGNLYNSYIDFKNKINSFDSNLDELLCGYIKDFYLSKIENFKQKGYKDITDGIDLLNYCIIEFNPDKLKFRITYNCYNYRMVNNVIVGGSNLEKREQVIILTYENHNGKWLISNFEKVYEKKLSK